MKSLHDVEPTFGSQLFKLRSRCGKSQRELAGEAGLSKSYLCDLENERRIPPPSGTTEALARAANASGKESAELRELATRGRQRIDVKVAKTTSAELAALLKWLAQTGPSLPIDRIANIRAALEKDM